MLRGAIGLVRKGPGAKAVARGVAKDARRVVVRGGDVGGAMGGRGIGIGEVLRLRRRLGRRVRMSSGVLLRAYLLRA